VIVGGAHIAIPLAELAKTMGYRTVIVDPRRAFATEARFPAVDRLIPAWPGEAFRELPLTKSTAVVTLSHDPKIDEPALSLALPSAAFYVGALGSRTTQAKRRERLKAQGLADSDLDRLHGPVGLDLSAESPEEIALSIMAQIISTRNSRP
jgi:xanthine dehydrogenase accessory factor